MLVLDVVADPDTGALLFAFLCLGVDWGLCRTDTRRSLGPRDVWERTTVIWEILPITVRVCPLGMMVCGPM
jgi:hypothetical protein